ncbi:hypothetical protein BGX38DRAFT_1310808 [Terfezia claveryi]|nr:hypothetical protein BGX38DRAFT_1310808 [Terfezia claveryi]
MFKPDSIRPSQDMLSLQMYTLYNKHKHCDKVGQTFTPPARRPTYGPQQTEASLEKSDEQPGRGLTYEGFYGGIPEFDEFEQELDKHFSPVEEDDIDGPGLEEVEQDEVEDSRNKSDAEPIPGTADPATDPPTDGCPYTTDVTSVSPTSKVSFKSGYTLWKQMDQMVVDPKWTTGSMQYALRPKSDFYYQNIVDCIKYLLRQRAFVTHVIWEPVRLFNKDNDRIYSEMNTTTWWWEQQKLIPVESTLVPVLLASD